MDLERSWLELLNLTHAREPTPMVTTDMASVIAPVLLSSLFTTVLGKTSGPDLRLDNQTFLVNGFIRIVLRTLIDRLAQVVEAERASVPIQEASRLRSSTRSSAKANVRTRLRVGHSALSAHYQGLHLKKECGWLIEQFVVAVKSPSGGRLVQRAFCRDVSMHGRCLSFCHELYPFFFGRGFNRKSIFRRPRVYASKTIIVCPVQSAWIRHTSLSRMAD
jgi:hypothetical protein